MKEIRAYVRPFKLDSVAQALFDIPGFPGMSVSDCQGVGKDRGPYGEHFDPFYATKRIEMFVEDEVAERIVATLLTEARTGNPGDGIVIVSPVPQPIRIRNGEFGSR